MTDAEAKRSAGSELPTNFPASTLVPPSDFLASFGPGFGSPRHWPTSCGRRLFCRPSRRPARAPANAPASEIGSPALHMAGHSRGEAIQAGMEEHELVDDELLDIAAEMLPEVRMTASAQSEFRLPIPVNKELHGYLLFLQVQGIEDGFLVPDGELGVLLDMQGVDQWRG